MRDLLLSLSANPTARRAVKALGIPLPLPAVLARDAGPVRANSLEGRSLVLEAGEGARLAGRVREGLAGAGAREGAAGSADLLVLDATGVRDVAGLRWLYERAQLGVRGLGRGARVAILAGLVEECEGPVESAAVAAIEGFARSLAKELGRTGSTVNLLRAARDAGERVLPVLRWVLSAKSAFVTGQVLRVGTEARARVEGELSSVERALGGKIALVTGAARGIGEATARALAREGATVWCLDRPEDAQAVRALAQALGGRALLADLAKSDAVHPVLEQLGETALDVVVHNAGVTRDKTLARMDPAQWDAVLGVNLAAVLALTEALAPRVRDGGRFVALSSVSGIAGNVGQTAYAASKAGVLGWTRAQAKALAPRGVTVNAVAPGFIETRMTAAMPVMIREGARRLSALGQGGRPEDVAEAVLFLASPGAQGLTGSTLRVCGGAFVGA